ncbi:DUF5681 domain-containing protein [Oricola indica]|uniref:DUF5681 domain-containing protein n=1 Tax=Oricola indica TaxID=2872591 RepID=UPI003CCC0BB9
MAKNHENNEDIGYKKPPKTTRWKKGQSGNPRGRKKKPRDANGLLKLELEKVITIRDGGEDVRITKKEALITSLVNDGIKGNAKAREMMMRLLDVDSVPEPFIANDNDQALLDEFLKQNR